ncbi:MAG: hypothetical protein OEX09_07265, partial [Candidatus Bathyarchaeota archaeon]|nr:hypothetical protein [Candidatus Bathyarchaeota archaeon]
DTENRITAMARTTAYPASIIGQLIASKAIEEKGVIPLEKLGAKERLFNKILLELEKRQVKIVESRGDTNLCDRQHEWCQSN